MQSPSRSRQLSRSDLGHHCAWCGLRLQRAVFCRRRCSLAFIISFKSAAAPVCLWQIGLFGKRRIFEKIGEGRGCVSRHTPHSDISQEVVIAGGWFLANHAAKALLKIAFSSTSEGTPRELREPYLAESDPVPRRSHLRRFLNASSRPLVPCVERWNESCAAQWRPTRLGCDVPECHVLSKTRALSIAS